MARVWVAVVAYALSVTSARAAEVRVGQPVMGTVLQVTVVAADAQLARRLADDCVARALHWDDVLTTWRAEGELARLNERAGSGPVSISPDLWMALARMMALAHETRGAFDPAVGKLVDRWRRSSQGPLPLRLPLSRALQLREGRAVLAAGVALDAGGIGKGIAIDDMLGVLRRGGATAAFVDFGGSSLHALGAPADDPAGWVVALSGVDDGEILGTIPLRDASVSTSKSGSAGEEAGPIVSPQTGEPSPRRRLATVVASDATAADAWSTALVVLGVQGLAMLEESGLAAVFQEGGEVHMNAPMRKKIASVGQK